MKTYLNLKVLVVLAAFFTCTAAFAADVVDVPLDHILMQLFGWIASLFQKSPDQGDLEWALKVGALISIMLSSLKSSALRPFWDKLGNAKALAGPVLGIVAGVLAMIAHHEPITLRSLLEYFAAGGGAIAFHEILGWVRGLPGLNKYIAMAIDLVEMVLRRPDGGQNLAALGKNQASQ